MHARALFESAILPITAAAAAAVSFSTERASIQNRVLSAYDKCKHSMHSMQSVHIRQNVHSKQSMHGMQSRHSVPSRVLTSNQECCAVGAKLVPEGREEVDELEDLGASLAASQLVPENSWQQKEDEVGQEASSLHVSISLLPELLITSEAFWMQQLLTSEAFGLEGSEIGGLLSSEVM